MQWEDLQLSCFIKRGRELFSIKRNLLICDSKKEITKFCNKLSMKENLHVEFYMEKYNLNYKPHIYKSDINFYKYPSKSIHKIPKL